MTILRTANTGDGMETQDNNTTRNRSIALGRIEEKEAIAMRMYNKGYEVKEIANVVAASVNLVKQWIDASAKYKR